MTPPIETRDAFIRINTNIENYKRSRAWRMELFVETSGERGENG